MNPATSWTNSYSSAFCVWYSISEVNDQIECLNPLRVGTKLGAYFTGYAVWLLVQFFVCGAAWCNAFVNQYHPFSDFVVVFSVPDLPWCTRLFLKQSKYICVYLKIYFNSSPPSVAYRHQWIRSALVQIMACRLFGTKPSSEPMLSYCHSDPKEQTAVKFLIKFYSWKWKYSLRNGSHFVQGEMS